MNAGQIAAANKSFDDAIRAFASALELFARVSKSQELRSAKKALAAAEEGKAKLATYTRHMQAGDSAKKSENYAKCISEYEKALEVFPGDIDAKGRLETARQEQDAAYTSLFSRGQKEADEEDWDHAIEALKSAVSVAPKRLEAKQLLKEVEGKKWSEIGMKALQDKRFGEAVSALSKAQQHLGDNDGVVRAYHEARFKHLVQLAETHLTNGEYRLALQYAKELVELSPAKSKAKQLFEAAELAVRFGQVAHTRAHDAAVSAIYIASGGTSIRTVSIGGEAKTWALEDGRLELISTMTPSLTNRVTAVALSYDGRLLALGDSSGRISVVRFESNAKPAEIPEEDSPVSLLSYSRDTTALAAGFESGQFKKWRIEVSGNKTGLHEVRILASFGQDRATCIALNPTGRRLAVGFQSGSIRVVDVSGSDIRERTLNLRGVHRFPVAALCYSPDRTTLATAGEDRSVIAWETTTGRIGQGAKLHSAKVSGMAFSGDGRLFASSSADRTAVCWRLAEKAPLPRIPAHSAAVSSITLSPDARFLATGATDGQVKVWSVAPVGDSSDSPQPPRRR